MIVIRKRWSLAYYREEASQFLLAFPVWLTFSGFWWRHWCRDELLVHTQCHYERWWTCWLQGWRGWVMVHYCSLVHWLCPSPSVTRALRTLILNKNLFWSRIAVVSWLSLIFTHVKVFNKNISTTAIIFLVYCVLSRSRLLVWTGTTRKQTQSRTCAMMSKEGNG